MTIHEYLMKAIQDDARRAGERDRLLREARRARRARRQRLVSAMDPVLRAAALTVVTRSGVGGTRLARRRGSRARERLAAPRPGA
jgi:hypothetical protein